MGDTWLRETAEDIVEDILKDMTGRKGLRQSWEEIDLEIQDEIREVWVKAAEKHIAKVTGH